MKNEGGSWIISWGDFDDGVFEYFQDDVWQRVDVKLRWFNLSDNVRHRVSRVTNGIRYSAVFYTPKGAHDEGCHE
eukprot:4011343-Amphidinium_carterae.1